MAENPGAQVRYDKLMPLCFQCTPVGETPRYHTVFTKLSVESDGVQDTMYIFSCPQFHSRITTYRFNEGSRD